MEDKGRRVMNQEKSQLEELPQIEDANGRPKSKLEAHKKSKAHDEQLKVQNVNYKARGIPEGKRYLNRMESPNEFGSAKPHRLTNNQVKQPVY